MDARFPFQVASWWAGMALGIPMLAAELAAEIWRPDPPKPAPVPTGPADGNWDGMSDARFRSMTRDVGQIRTRFTTEGLDAVVKAAKRPRKRKAS
jgi:hypothetical protein